MNVTKLAWDTQLRLLVKAAQAEGFRFMERAQLELSAGDFGNLETILFGVATEKLVGVGGLTPDPYPDAEPDTGRLRHLYVLPRYRRLGVGQKLVAAVMQEATQHYPVLRLRTPTPEAAHFYETLGFAAVTEPNATHVLAFG